MLWAALLLPPGPDATPPCDDRVRGVATWALQFSPRVAFADEAVVIELEASVRLFGGKRRLRDRVLQEAKELGVAQLAWAPTSLAALACGRAGFENGFRKPLAELLDGLPLETLSAARPHQTTLSQLGCQTLGDLRRLPRGGIGRRFDKALLTALDRAYGLVPEAHDWLTLPDTFRSRLELMSRVETAPALLFGARRLLLQLCGWLAARHAGTTAFTLRWAHDAMRPRAAGEGGELTIRTAQPTRSLEHLCRLLAEHLAKTPLEAAVGDLELRADEVHPFDEQSASLLPDVVNQAESLNLVLERLAARLGPERVLRPVVAEDHRPEWMQHWQPAPQPLPKKRARSTPLPQPGFLLPEPLRLAVRRQDQKPMYQGVLQLITGPHRVEGGWWHRVAEQGGAQVDGQGGAQAAGAAGQRTLNVQRDYWVAFSEHAGVLWIYQERLADDQTAWYLHGSFS
jgi:protein ImuB